MPGVEAIVKFINGGKNEEHGNHGGDAEEDDHIFFLHTIRKRVNQSERNLSKLFRSAQPFGTLSRQGTAESTHKQTAARFSIVPPDNSTISLRGFCPE